MGTSSSPAPKAAASADDTCNSLRLEVLRNLLRHISSKCPWVPSAMQVLFCASLVSVKEALQSPCLCLGAGGFTDISLDGKSLGCQGAARRLSKMQAKMGFLDGCTGLTPPSGPESWILRK